MVRFKLKNKGRVTQWFGGKPEQYKPLGLAGHNGIDTVVGWDKPVAADNPGLIYKIIENPVSNWAGTYQLVPEQGDEYVEICQGHFNKVLVKEGDTVIEGQHLGLEGNKGMVFSGGVRITPEMQDAGDRRGTHTHTQYRPVRRVKQARRGRHYLNANNGNRYRDAEGYFYEIIQNDNGFRGCVDPMRYHRENTIMEDIRMIAGLIKLIK